MLGFSKKSLKVFLPDHQTMFYHYKCSNWLLLYDVNKSLFGKGNFSKTKYEGGEYPMLSAKAVVVFVLVLPSTHCPSSCNLLYWLLRQWIKSLLVFLFSSGEIM